MSALDFPKALPGFQKMFPDEAAWSATTEGREKYREVRAAAQAGANRTGYDVGIERNGLFKTFRWFMLPGRQFRQGHELRCEIVHPENLGACQPGHGP